MRALVIYETLFGNTKAVARAVAEGLGAVDCVEVEVLSIDDAPLVVPDGVGLVVAGGPTHAFSMSRPTTRADAVRQGAPEETAPVRGLRDWVDAVHAPPSVRFAVYDTRVDRVRRIPGSAAHQAGRHLRRRGFRLASGPTSYFVGDTFGPLLGDELAKARQWGETLARFASSTIVPA